MYWSSSSKIHRAEMDGANQEIIASHLGRVYGVALDVKLNQIYFIRGTYYGSIFYIDIDNVNRSVKTLIVHTRPRRGIAVDDQYVYFGTWNGVVRTKKNGRFNGTVEIIAKGLGTPLGITILKGNTSTRSEYVCCHIRKINEEHSCKHFSFLQQNVNLCRSLRLVVYNPKNLVAFKTHHHLA